MELDTSDITIWQQSCISNINILTWLTSRALLEEDILTWLTSSALIEEDIFLGTTYPALLEEDIFLGTAYPAMLREDIFLGTKCIKIFDHLWSSIYDTIMKIPLRCLFSIHFQLTIIFIIYQIWDNIRIIFPIDNYTKPHGSSFYFWLNHDDFVINMASI